MNYYLQTNEQNGLIWEEVDEFLFENYKKCEITVADMQQRRYTGNRIKKSPEGAINLDFEYPLSTADIGHICRFLEIKIPIGSIPGGFLRSPQFVPFTGRNGKKMIRNVGVTSFKEV